MQQKTSLLANEYMEKSGKKLSQREIVARCLKSGFKGTYKEISMRCGLSESQVEKRLSEIEGVKPTGQVRKTSPNSNGNVWGYFEPKKIETDIKPVQSDLFA